MDKVHFGGRRALVLVAVGLTLAGGVAAAAPASRTQAVEVNLAYTCQFPSGAQAVAAQFTATFPAAGTVGAAIQPEDVALTLTVPQGAFTATTLSGSARLTVSVAHDEDSADAVWSGLEIPATSVPSAGDLILNAAGKVPGVKISEPGEVTFSAGNLALELGSESSAACAPDTGPTTRLASVAVSETPSSSSRAKPSTTAPKTTPEDTIEIGPATPGERSQDQRALAGTAPEGCFDLPTNVPNPTLGCGYLAGYANVKKQNASVLFGSPDPGFLQISYSESSQISPTCDSRFPPPNDGPLTCTLQLIHSRAALAMPAADSSLLVFGFMPVRGKVELTPTSDIIIDSLQQTRRYSAAPRFRYSLKVTATATMKMRLYDVTVNGVPLDVGPNCHTEKPLEIALSGSAANSNAPTPDEYTVPAGGPLSGSTEIPAFSGCGAGEDLDPLLTGTISGPDNAVKMTQGKPCFQTGGSFGVCPPTVPVPRRYQSGQK
jgi:hypothetical protein